MYEYAYFFRDFVTICLICGFHVKLLSMLTPRNFVCVERGIVSTFIFIRLSLIVKVPCLV